MKVKNRLIYNKKGGVFTTNATFSCYFFISKNPQTLSYIIQGTDFFSTLYTGNKLIDFFMISMFITFPFAFHAIMHQKKKWFVLIIVLNLIGVLLYFVLEIKKKKHG